MLFTYNLVVAYFFGLRCVVILYIYIRGCFQLVDMQWSLGMSMASSNCRNLNSPFVSVVLKVAEQSGVVTERSFEMTVPEFKVTVLFAVPQTCTDTPPVPPLSFCDCQTDFTDS